MSNLFVISGPSGVGKGTLVKMLLEKHPEIVLSISATTRQPRPGEENGVHYFFVEKEVFLDRVNQGKFLEWEEFAGNYYGTDDIFVRNQLNQGNNVLLEIDVKGALQVKRVMPEAILIFIEPPSLEELQDRLFKRKTESEEEIQKRLSIVKSELDQRQQFDHCIINNDLEKALQELEEVIHECPSKIKKS